MIGRGVGCLPWLEGEADGAGRVRGERGRGERGRWWDGAAGKLEFAELPSREQWEHSGNWEHLLDRWNIQ